MTSLYLTGTEKSVFIANSRVRSRRADDLSLKSRAGQAAVLIRLAEEGVRVVGMDLDAAMLEVARNSSESTKQTATVITRWEGRGKMKSV